MRVVALAVLLLGFGSTAGTEAQRPADSFRQAQQASLKGLRGFTVYVDSLSPAARAVGLDERAILQRVRSELQGARMTEWPRERLMSEDAGAALTITVQVEKAAEPNVYMALWYVQVMQAVFLPRNPPVKAFGATWQMANGGVVSAGISRTVIENVGAMVNRLAVDYMVANR